MFFDTHCHLNFEAFDGRVDEVINKAKKAGVNQIVIPGTDVPTSKKAVAIAEKFDGIYAAVGIHPHHIMQYQISNIKYQKDRSNIKNIKQDVIPAPDRSRGQAPAGIQADLIQIEKMLLNKKVIAIGEIGIDRHIYQKTKYPDYQIEKGFVDLQKEFFIEQIKLAKKYDKSLIFHNREAKSEVLKILTDLTDSTDLTEYRSVFHCCEPDPELLEFAKDHKMFIGVDGDITYYKAKQEFIKTVPLDMLVLETDSPFLNPEPYRKKEGGVKNEPKNIPLIAEFVAKLKGISVDEVAEQTTENACVLFKVSP